MLEVTTLRWALTIGVIVGLFALDLGLAAARPHVVGFREAALSSVFFIAVAIVFGVVFTAQAGGDFGTQYFAGYLLEKSLSIDNLFVFVIIMTTFAVLRSTSKRSSSSVSGWHWSCERSSSPWVPRCSSCSPSCSWSSAWC